MERVIFEQGNFRILEVDDEDFDMENLKGDIFNPEHIKEMHDSTMTIEKLKQDEIAFEFEVSCVGVFGYVLEKWNSNVGIGWEHVDSCFGFVGAFDEKVEKRNHYIVAELKDQIKGE